MGSPGVPAQTEAVVSPNTEDPHVTRCAVKHPKFTARRERVGVHDTHAGSGRPRPPMVHMGGEGRASQTRIIMNV